MGTYRINISRIPDGEQSPKEKKAVSLSIIHRRQNHLEYIWIDLDCDEDQWRALVNAVMNLLFPLLSYSRS
jgi:hypothetical protein